MAAIQDVARQFFDACEAGKGWAACQAYCKPDASFSSQAEPLVDVKTLQGYADWMQGLMKMMPDGHYDLKCWATDTERNNVIAYATFICMDLVMAVSIRPGQIAFTCMLSFPQDEAQLRVSCTMPALAGP